MGKATMKAVKAAKEDRGQGRQGDENARDWLS
jgi:hypothetical protein